MIKQRIPRGWQDHLADEIEKPYYAALQEFVRKERAEHEVYPPEPEVFSALDITPLDRVSVVLLGQDPYHGKNQAHGLSFSVRPGVKQPPSLVNIFKELESDIGAPRPNNGYLVPWAEQGVLLLNAVLTVRAHEPNSHKGKGWETFTDKIIQLVNEQEERVVFLLWGAYAQKKGALVDTKRHRVLPAAHPSPFAADKGFFGSKPFSKANAELKKAGRPTIDWAIPDIGVES